MRNVYSVGQVNHYVKNMFTQDYFLRKVYVKGEVSNCKYHTSGHIYFSLKDENALLQAVWFKGSQKERETFDPLTGEVFEDGPRTSLAGTLRNGQQIICAGRLTVYAPRGGYQLVVELAQDSGEGQLHLALEALKRKLAEKGYFSLERKRPIPEHPHRVAVITAPSGAAIRDFLRLSGERGTGCEIRIHPAPVQGDDAPPLLAEAIGQANAEAWADLIVLIRGGGSLQDLWAFNDERVARAIFESRLPVLTGVGHEIDHSIADFVADRSAATPSHAAQMLWPERSVYAQRVDDAESLLEEAMRRKFGRLTLRLTQELRALTLLSPARRLQRQRERLEDMLRRLDSGWNLRLVEARRRAERQEERLCRHGGGAPLETRARGLAALSARLDGAAAAAFSRSRRDAENLCFRLDRLFPSLLSEHGHALELLALKLKGVNPLAPLERGYALARTRDGHVVKSIHELAPGQRIRMELRDGAAESDIIALHPVQA